MANIENPNIPEVPETPETNVPEQGIDANEAVEATGEDLTDDVWEGDIGDLRDEPPYEPPGQEVTMSHAHENVSRTEFPNAPDVKTDFNNAANPSENPSKQSETPDRNDHNFDPPEPPAP
jgi:hypothetical protein